jgi:PAS domain S-box-containing protein
VFRCGLLSLQPRRVRAGVAALALVAVAATISEFVFPATAVASANVAWLAAGSAAMLACTFARRQTHGERRRVWGLLLAAMVSWSVGELFWVGFSLAEVPRSPHPADLAWFATAALGAVATYRLTGVPRRLASLEAFPLVVAIGAVIAALFSHAFVHSALPLTERVSALAYPIIYVTAAAVFLQSLIAGGRPLLRDASLRFAWVGFAIEAAAFALWAPKLLAGTYEVGAAIDGLWTVGLLVLALGGLCASSEHPAPRPSFGRGGILPALAFFALLAALLTFSVGGRELAPRVMLQVGLLAVGVLLFVRTALVSRAERLALEAAEQAEDQYRELVEGLPLVSYQDSVTDGSCLYISPQVVELLGYPTSDWTRNHQDVFRRAVHPDDREAVLAAAVRSHETGLKFNMEYRLIAADGRVVWVRDESVVVRDDCGRPAFVQGFWLDITARKELEEQLRQSQKMEAVGQLAGGIAHDFNNLLTAISGYNAFALERLNGGDPELRRDLGEVQKAAGRAAELTQQLLAFSRRQVLTPQVLDLNESVQDTLALLRRLIGEDIEIVTELDEAVGRVKVDPVQLQQVLVNLAVNARDAMPNGGTLTLCTEARAGHSCVRVSDTGTGMDEATRARIFEPFFTTKQQGEGTGLGLATVDGIVEQSGGYILVDTAPGEGTSFSVCFPVTLDGGSAAEPESVVPRNARTSVLLVEDDATVRRLVRRMLELQGHSVLEAATPGEALELIRAGHESDLLLTDVVMPEMSGRDLADRLRLERPELKVLFTSGYAGDSFIDRKVLEPGMPFLEKPFGAEELAAKLADVLVS